MPNCEWGRPCDCLDCRTTHKTFSCPECGFETTVSIVGTVRFFTERDGSPSSETIFPEKPLMDLACYSCSHVMKKKAFYTEISETHGKPLLKKHRKKKDGLTMRSSESSTAPDFCGSVARDHARRPVMPHASPHEL
jgi:hypothetical protein